MNNSNEAISTKQDPLYIQVMAIYKVNTINVSSSFLLIQLDDKESEIDNQAMS